MIANGSTNGIAHDELTVLRERVATLEQLLDQTQRQAVDLAQQRDQLQAQVDKPAFEQEQQAQLIKRSEAYLRAMFGAMHDLVLVLGKDGTYLDIPPTNADLHYRASSDLLGKRLTDVMPLEIANQYLALIHKVIETRATEQFIYSLQNQAGEIWFNATISPLNDRSVLWVARDITGQRQAEAERITLQEEVIAAQQASLRELSTPIIPLTDHVVAMPLIGTIDSSRAQQVIETLLDGVATTRATTAILDITGVQVVDTQVANALLRAAQAVKLLGAQVIITGIRPEVAQTLVGLGLDLSTIVTRSSLQSGISFALAGRSISDIGDRERKRYN
jgi:rsbT co-antagonist protein RsbR